MTSPWRRGFTVEQMVEQALKKYFTEFMKEVWRKGEIPKDWKTSVLVPI